MVPVYIIEKITNELLTTYVEKYIFNPVGMYEYGMGATLPGDIFITEGYTKKENELFIVPRLRMTWLNGCCGIYTVAGMKRLDEVITEGNLLSRQSLSVMLTVSLFRKYGCSSNNYSDYYHNHGVLACCNTFNNFNWNNQTCVILFSNV